MVSQSVAGLLVLIVDDDPDARAIVRAALSRFGAVVAEAASVREARDWLQQWIPSLLICDLALPGESGLELIRWLRAESGANIRCAAIAYSGLSAHEHQPRALGAGFDAFFPKSVFPELLASHLRLAARKRDLGT